MNAEALADLDLNGQAVGVPAGFAFTELAPHRPVTGVEVFDGPGQAVTRVGHAVGRGRALKKDKSFGSSSVVERLLVDASRLPELGDIGFSSRQVGPAADGFKHERVRRMTVSFRGFSEISDP